jgi:hypothetical protein
MGCHLNRLGADPDYGTKPSVDQPSPAQVDLDSPTSPALSFSPWSSTDESTSSESDSDENPIAKLMPPAFDDLCKDAEHLIDRLVDIGVAIR